MSNFEYGGYEIPEPIMKIIDDIKRHLKPILIGILLLIIILGSFFKIDPEELGIITRFGKFTRTVDPGLNFKIPFIESVIKVPVERQQKLEFGFRTTSTGSLETGYTKTNTQEESLMLTGDLNLADVEWVVQYRVDDAYNFLFKVKNPESTLRDISEATMRLIVGE